MKSTSLEIFWVEKIKLTQNTINITQSLSDQQLDYVGTARKTCIRKSLGKMFETDRKFAFYLPFSIRMSQLLPLSPIQQDDIEAELIRIRDLFDPPALPPFLSEIISRNSGDLDYSQSNPSLLELWKGWASSLSQIEGMINSLTENEALKIRYFTLTGIYALPSMINLTAMQNHHCLKEGVLSLIKDPNFPSIN
jgi:hypothetical protein